MPAETDDPVEIYLRELSTVPPLTEHEEDALFQQLRRGEGHVESAERRLIESKLPLVVDIAKRYSSSGVPLLDLIQEGNIGLWKAIQTFAKSPSGEFSAHASVLIDAAIRKAISESNERGST